MNRQRGGVHHSAVKSYVLVVIWLYSGCVLPELQAAPTSDPGTTEVGRGHHARSALHVFAGLVSLYGAPTNNL